MLDFNWLGVRMMCWVKVHVRISPNPMATIIFILLLMFLIKCHFSLQVNVLINYGYFFKGLIKFLVPINIHSFVFSPYKIKSHFLVFVTFSLSLLGTKTVARNFLQGLKVLMEKFIGTKNADGQFYRD